MKMTLSFIFFFILFSKISEAQEDVRIELMLPFDGLTCSTECYVPIDTYLLPEEYTGMKHQFWKKYFA